MVPCPECGALLRGAAACPWCGVAPSAAVRRALELVGVTAAAAGVTLMGACSSAYGITFFDSGFRDGPILVADPPELALEPGESGTLALLNVGDDPLELLGLPVDPPDAGFAVAPIELPRTLGAGDALEVAVGWSPVGPAAVDGHLVVESDALGPFPIDLHGAATTVGVTVEAPELATAVPCDRELELRLLNGTGRAIAATATFPGLDPERIGVDAPISLDLEAGGSAVVPVTIRGARPGSALLTLQLASDDPAGDVAFSAPVVADYASRATARATGSAVVELPAEADPTSALVSVNGAPATDVAVVGRTVTVNAPPVGPGDEVAVDYGVRSSCD